jgi:hypothetical protein
MTDQDRVGPDGCQGARKPVSGASRWIATICPESFAPAAFCRRAALTVLFLSYGLGTSQLLARTLKELSGSLRTADHVHLTTRRAGDTLLITLRIDPGYHVNANPASNEYLIPTSVAFEGVTPQRIAYPPAASFKPAFTDEPISVFEGTAIIAATFPPGVLDRVQEAGFTLTAQACTTAICLPPDDISGRATW